MTSPEELARNLHAISEQRYTSGANQTLEREAYERALSLGAKSKNKTAKKEVVVAHTNESMDWINGLDEDILCTIYEKGDGTGGVKLPNVGRDLHTYLYHVASQYDKLADVTFFLQGWPFDRSIGIIPAVNWLSNVSYVEFGSDILDTGTADKQLQEFFHEILGKKAPAGWCFRGNVQFAASRQVIQFRSREFYISCAVMLEDGNKKLGIGAETALYLFEQIWPFIFQH